MPGLVPGIPDNLGHACDLMVVMAGTSPAMTTSCNFSASKLLYTAPNHIEGGRIND
jgi:hypothetical protein